MRKIIFLFIISATTKTYSQISASIIDDKLNQIKNISCQMKNISFKQYGGFQPKLMLEFSDNALTYIVNQDTFAIPILIEKIADTSLTNLMKPGGEDFFRKGDLATLLISYIEFMPFALISGDQWCSCCDAGYLPTGFLNYVDKSRIIFQTRYKAYYYSQERKESLKQAKKNLKRFSRRRNVEAAGIRHTTALNDVSYPIS
ncbi:MAG: hypothetical protein ABIN97_13000 [Ginsengibacter sp.]